MLGYQTQSHGSTAGLTMYGSRGYSYALPVQHQHMMKNSIDWSEAPMLTVKDLPHWATSLKKYAADGLRPIPDLPAPKSIMATAMAEPADLSRLVDIEFAAFRDEKVNHHLSYRDASDTSHLKRTMRAYRKYMNNLRSLPDDSKRLAKTAQTHRRTDSAHDFSLGFMFRKVESPEGGEIIAFCKSEMAEMTPQDMLTPLDVGHEGEPQMNRDWFALNEQCHREYCGTRKHCCKCAECENEESADSPRLRNAGDTSGSPASRRGDHVNGRTYPGS